MTTRQALRRFQSIGDERKSWLTVTLYVVLYDRALAYKAGIFLIWKFSACLVNAQ